MKCAECRGACCESFSLGAEHLQLPGDDEQRWLALHARPLGALLEFECRCTALTGDGRCGVYSTRPVVCVLFQAGGRDCLDTVRRRRTPEQYLRIREENDPPTLENHDS